MNEIEIPTLTGRARVKQEDVRGVGAVQSILSTRTEEIDRVQSSPDHENSRWLGFLGGAQVGVHV